MALYQNRQFSSVSKTRVPTYLHLLLLPGCIHHINLRQPTLIGGSLLDSATNFRLLLAAPVIMSCCFFPLNGPSHRGLTAFASFLE